MKRFFIACAFSFLSAGLAFAVTGSPKADMEATVENLVSAVEANPGSENTVARRAALRKIITPKFDFEEMSKRSLGMHWQTISPQEQRDFVAAFSELLARTYLSRIEDVERGMVKVVGEKIVDEQTAPKALVKTVVTYKGDTFPIDYKLFVVGGAWKVYDVVIENIGLVANYRNEFSGIIRKEKFSGLLAKLQDKAATPQKGDS